MGFGEGVFCFRVCAWWLQGSGGAWSLALWLGGCVRDRSGYPTATEGRHRAWAVARSNSG
ncbi:hypothetical protein [Riemerella anatipestifer]|uniref:hypothetical protein n=1 Tax=Riemerella anatipestifer TaxID=34085 RepID=UPI001BDACF5B|nr:hypothetical protein [Riemerella anatipestifer]MBT0556753.1 hypothetical protein [Riemerella anatipestifer]